MYDDIYYAWAPVHTKEIGPHTTDLKQIMKLLLMPGISSSADSKYITTYTGKKPHSRVFPSKHTNVTTSLQHHCNVVILQ